MKTKTLFLFNIIFITFTSIINAQNNCGTCDKKPGHSEKFKNALIDSKLHYYTNEGKTKLDLKKAEEECHESYFVLCNDLLVLTSSGKKKDRTEIRQDKNLSLNQYSAMEFSAIFENTPTSNDRKGVTIGQIHNDTKGVKRPLLRVEIAGGNEIRVIVTDSFIKGEGNTENDFLVSFNEKDKIECKIEINKRNKVTVSVKNVTSGKKKKISYPVSELWQKMDGQFYFKAGAYTQVSGPKTKVSYDKFNFIYD